MAALRGEKDLLNHTINGLRYTSKGQLSYDKDWQINADVSKQLSCSLESFLNESTVSPCFEENEWSTTTLENVTEFTSKTEFSDSLITVKESNIPINYDVENKRSIKQYHEECRGDAEQRKAKREHMFERRMQNLKQDSENVLRRNQGSLAEGRREYDEKINKSKQQDAEELQRLKIELEKQTKMYGVKLDKILTRALAEENVIAMEREERRAVLENLKKKTSSLYQHVLKSIDIIEQKFTDSEHMSFVDAQVYEDISARLNEIGTKGRRVVVAIEAIDEPSNAKKYFEFMSKLMQATFSIDAKVTNILEEAQEKAVNALKKKELEVEKIKREAMKQEQEEQQRLQEQKSREIKKDVKSSEKELPAEHKNKLPAESTKNKGNEASSQKLLQFISTNTLEEYTTLQEHLSIVQASYKDFISDSAYTKYKFDLQKAVNTPINALSAHSPSQLNDKILRLVTLLSGSNVEVGGKRVNCKNHPSAMIYCKDQVAKKLVMQGAQQVSSNPQSAFLYAAVIVGIWSAFPDVGQLILAHFHKNFPYLVPYYMPQVEGQSNIDFHRALGYSVNNDKVEDEDNFLKKFSGTVQLYAAVVTSKGATTPDHPHGIDKGWTWLARTLNLKPHPSITATMLYEFIKVAGHLLMKQYGKQFQKLLLMLFKEFIPAMDEVTPAKKKGPVQRFKDFLDECVKTRKIAVPKGYLTERWWQSGHF